ncbi:MAG: type 4a pilus biogenesis protein PilO [Candidatus Aminicenantes bacterium]|nr:type 4a pilus biogenesis protein PilO [Candidatus Aminicenantes bacterium]MCK5005653.1 type 4a pilus biogenesis protein PilO [Candidatus Aminicenantes bacterium]
MRKEVIISNFMLMLFAISLILLSISFIYSSVKTSSLEDLTEEKQIHEISEKKFATLRNNMKDWDNIEKEYLEFKNNMVLKFEDFSNFRKNLELLINRNSISKKNFRIEYKKALKNEYIKVKISMKLAGNYESFKKLIYEISRIDKIVYFRSVKMTGSGSDIRGDFKLEVYLVR